MGWVTWNIHDGRAPRSAKLVCSEKMRQEGGGHLGARPFSQSLANNRAAPPCLLSSGSSRAPQAHHAPAPRAQGEPHTARRSTLLSAPRCLEPTRFPLCRAAPSPGTAPLRAACLFRVPCTPAARAPSAHLTNRIPGSPCLSPQTPEGTARSCQLPTPRFFRPRIHSPFPRTPSTHLAKPGSGSHLDTQRSLPRCLLKTRRPRVFFQIPFLFQSPSKS